MAPKRSSRSERSGKNYPGTFSEFASFVCSNTSTHGGRWFFVLEGRPILQVICFILIAGAQIALLTLFVYQLFFSTAKNDLISSTEYVVAKEMMYPQMTICNPNPFSKKVIQEMNLSGDILSFISLIFNWYSPNSFNDPDEIDRLSKQYNELTKNMTILDLLLNKLTIRVEDFFIGCYSFDGAINCSSFFPKKPTFSEYGLCFTSIQMLSKSSWANIKGMTIVVNASRVLSQGFDQKRLGETLGIHDEFMFAPHYQDLGEAALFSKMTFLKRGTQTMFFVSTSEMDRRDLDLLASRYGKEDNRCVGESHPFARSLEAYGFPNWSFTNCLYFFTRYFFPNCNILATLGFNNSLLTDIPNRVCSPMDVLQANVDTTNALFNKNVTEFCYPGCSEVIVHSETADSILLDVDTKERLTDMIVVKVSLSSNIKAVHKMSIKPIGDTIANTGGWLGILMGASIISLLEILYFGIILMKVLIVKLIGMTSGF